ncbi:MAG: dehydrogenase [Gemmatimonadota bacterium]
MPRFIVIPRDNPADFADLSPDEMQGVIQRYHAWSMGLAEQGHLLMGEKLMDGQGKVLRGAGSAMSATDGPFVETKEVIGGFWLLQADDLDHATRLVSGCPHLESSGSLEIREIEEMD